MQLVHESRPVVPRDRFIRLPEVERLSAAKKSWLYQQMRDGKFPKCIRIGRMSAWSEAAVLQWVQDRIAAGAATGGEQSSGGQQ